MTAELEYFGIGPGEAREYEDRREYTAVVGAVSFRINYKVGYVDVFKDGKILFSTEVTAVDGQNVILTTPCVGGEKIKLFSRRQVPISDAYTRSDANSAANNFYLISSGTGDAAAGVTIPSVGFTLSDGREVKVRWLGTSISNAPTVNVNGLGVKTITFSGGFQVPTGFMNDGQEITLRYNVNFDRFEIVGASQNILVPPGLVGFFARNSAPTGWLKANGAAISVTTYSSLAAAIYCGDSVNATALFGYRCTNSAAPTTSRSTTGSFIVLPDLRGEFVRGWDDGRGIDTGRVFGSWQDGAIQSHNHTGTTSSDGNHNHTGVTDGIGDHQHVTPWGESNADGAYWGTSGTLGNQGSSGSDYDNYNYMSSWSGAHVHTFTSNNNGSHTHSITTNSTGGSETRTRNIALLACIKY